jgi:hypothetical protein
MIRILKKLFGKASSVAEPVELSSPVSPASAEVGGLATHSLYIQEDSGDEEVFSIESLKYDFERRLWHYERLKKTLKESNLRLLNWIGSIDYSGYTRQECLSALIANYEEGDENRILLRLEDWVPQVQELARDWVLENFSSLPLEVILENERVILYLSRRKRLESDKGFGAVKSDLIARVRSMSSSEFFQFSAQFRRYAYSLALGQSDTLREWIVDDPEPFNRLFLVQKYGYEELSELEVRRFKADTSVFVRRLFFQLQIDAGVTPSRDELVDLALDKNRSLRQRGQFYLKRIYSEDAYALYKSLDGKEFFYISDYAKSEDVEHFVRGVHSSDKAIQILSLKALAVTAPERLAELGLAQLIIKSRWYRYILVPVLPKILNVDEIQALRPAFEQSSERGIYSYLRVLERKSFWNFVAEGLILINSDVQSDLSEHIVHQIRNQHEIYHRLTPELREAIESQLEELKANKRNRYAGFISSLEFNLRNT